MNKLFLNMEIILLFIMFTVIIYFTPYYKQQELVMNFFFFFMVFSTYPFIFDFHYFGILTSELYFEDIFFVHIFLIFILRHFCWCATFNYCNGLSFYRFNQDDPKNIIFNVNFGTYHIFSRKNSKFIDQI